MRHHKSKNICGVRISQIRTSKKPFISQVKLATMLQLEGIHMDNKAVYRIESGIRRVSDIELKMIAKLLDVTYDELLN